jgi:hypothetical protein
MNMDAPYIPMPRAYEAPVCSAVGQTNGVHLMGQAWESLVNDLVNREKITVERSILICESKASTLSC